MKNFKIKLFSGVVAVLLLAGAVAQPASALTNSQIISLLVSLGVSAEQAAVVAAAINASGNVSNSCPVYTRDLTIGSTGSDVSELQTYLVAKGFLVMPAGVAKGYFGGLTQSALARYQASQGISPAVGYFGPITRANVQAKCTPVVDNDNDDDDDSSDDGDLEGGEASLEKFDLSSGDDSDVEEGDTAQVAEIEFDVEDGDVMINRIDLALVANSSNEEKDPWDVFESLVLMVDGDEIGEVDLSDEDEYLDEDDGTIRISNIDHIVREGETVTIMVEVSAQNGVDGADNDAAEWDIYVLDDGIRAEDSEGIQQYIGSDSDVVTFDVVEKGEGEELNVSSSNEDPDATTLKVEDDSKSDSHSILAFTLEGEDNDIELDTVQIELETGTANVNDVVSDLVLEIDGEEFDDWSFVSGADSTSAVVEFDIDGDFTLDADSEVTVILMAEFKAANGSNYSSGETIMASVADEAIEGEGADDVVSDGTATGEEHSLATEGIVIPQSGFSDEGSTSNNDANTSRDYEFSFEVTAFEEDFYIATSSVEIFVEGAGSADSTYTVDSSADEDTNGVFTVEEGETEVFTVVVTVSNVSTSGQYRVGLDSVGYTENPNGVSSLQTKDVVNSDFRTSYRTVNQ